MVSLLTEKASPKGVGHMPVNGHPGMLSLPDAFSTFFLGRETICVYDPNREHEFVRQTPGLAGICGRCQRAGRLPGKTLLDGFCATEDCHRKAGWWMLTGLLRARPFKRSGLRSRASAARP